MSKDIIHFSRGAQLMDGKGAYLFIPMMVFLLAFIGTCIFGATLAAVILFLLMSITAIFMLDVRGVIVDCSKNKIKEYVWRPWGKTGSWRSYQDFDSVYVDYESYSVKETELYDVDGNMTSVNAKYGHFPIWLVDAVSGEKIEVGDAQEYGESLKKARRIAAQLDLPLIDRFATRLRTSKRRRRR